MGRFNRLNCMVHIWHLVRVPGTRSRRKTFGVYPSTFSALEDHRVYIHGEPQGKKGLTDKLQRFLDWSGFLRAQLDSRYTPLN